MCDEYEMNARAAQKEADVRKAIAEEQCRYIDDSAALDRGSADYGSSDRAWLDCATCGRGVMSVRELSTGRYVAVLHGETRTHVELARNDGNGIAWTAADPKTRVLVRCRCGECYSPRVSQLREALEAAGSDGFVARLLRPAVTVEAGTE